MALITISHVTMAFDGVAAIQDVDLIVDKGDYLVVLGENGSGKSTLMRTMLGLLKPQQGRVIYGEGLTRRSIGYLPQQSQAQRAFPAGVEEVVLSGCTGRLGLKPFPGRRERELAREKLRMLDIEHLAKKSYRTLSGGQQQRVLLARALAATDALMILDEPITGLDPDASAELYGLLKKLNSDYGVAIVMVSHDLGGALKDAKRVLVMDRGVDFLGTPEEYLAEVKGIGRGA
ncbi:MAG: metal ABC transporter ATP-binding protein [Clostridiales bacterium]|nr:metal ABC transporter ATP-binding protein [Clostridiales bacterium]